MPIDCAFSSTLPVADVSGALRSGDLNGALSADCASLARLVGRTGVEDMFAKVSRGGTL